MVTLIFWGIDIHQLYSPVTLRDYSFDLRSRCIKLRPNGLRVSLDGANASLLYPSVIHQSSVPLLQVVRFSLSYPSVIRSRQFLQLSGVFLVIRVGKVHFKLELLTYTRIVFKVEFHSVDGETSTLADSSCLLVAHRA